MDGRTKDFTGQVFGVLKAIRPTEKRYAGGGIIWEFECIKCEKKLLRKPSELRENAICGNKECRIGISIEDLTNKIFGRLTVKSFQDSEDGRIYWNCLCTCENTKVIQHWALLGGGTQSCGCLRKESMQIPAGEASWNNRWKTHSQNASLRSENEIVKEYFIEICSMDCFYCDLPPQPWNVYMQQDRLTTANGGKMSKENLDRSWINTNGIDRVDNEKGYLLNNSVPCCWGCNSMKINKNLYQWLDCIERFQSGFAVKILEKLEKAGIAIPPKNNP
jgi:hypothetical protein